MNIPKNISHLHLTLSIVIISILIIPSTAMGSIDLNKNIEPLGDGINKLDSELAEQVYGNGALKVKVKIIFKGKVKKQLGTASADMDIESSILSEGGKVKHRYKSFDGFAAEIDSDKIAGLSRNPNIERIEIDREIRAFLTESVPLIRANDTWPLQIAGTNLTGKGVTVCIIDTGVDYNHPNLGGGLGPSYKVIGGYDFVNSDSDPLDDNGHGTHVAGIVAANGSLLGIAPEAKIVAVKVLDSAGSGFSSDMDAGIDWCVDNSATYNISIISLSLGGSSYSDYCDSTETSTRNAINTAVLNNISVIVATGNDGVYTGISSPGCIRNSTRVGATYDRNVGSISWSACTDSTTAKDQLTCFTNRGPNFNDILLAPGALINSTWLNSKSPFRRYSESGGTSMATPVVSGVAALVFQQYQLVNGSAPPPGYIRGRLNSTGVPLLDSQTGFTYYRVDAYNATNIMDSIPPVITIISPANRSYNTSLIDYNITVNENISLASINIDGGNNVTLYNSSALNWYNLSNSHPALSQGSHIAAFYAWDLSGNLNSATVFFQVDLTPPQILIYSPLNTTYYNSTLNLNVSANEEIDSWLYNLDGAGNVTFQPNASIAISSSGSYDMEFWCNDSAGNWNRSIRSFTLILPLYITENASNSPGNQSYNTGSVHFNITSSKAISNAFYSIDGATNKTMGNDSQIHYFNTTNPALGEGLHNVTFWINDSDGNMNSSTVYFQVDQTNPQMSFRDPTPSRNANTTETNISFNMTISETYPDSIIFNWNGTNETLTYSGNSVAASRGNLTDSTYSYYSFINDTAGNSNISEIRYITVDTQHPYISNVEPGNNSWVKGIILVNVTAGDSGSGISSVIANISNSTSYISYNLINSGDIWNISLNSTQLEDGDYNLSIYVWDQAGLMNSTGNTIHLDNTPPVIAIASPSNTTYSDTSILLNFSVNENTSWTGYSLNGASNITSANTTITAVSGANNITIYANDSSNNRGSTIVHFYIDESPPSISGLRLSRHIRVNGTTTNTTTITWNVSDHSGIDTQWVTANYSHGTLYNFTYTSSPFTLEVREYGTYNITVFANDTYGYLASDSILLYAEYYVSPVNVTINASNYSYVVNESNIKIRITANDSANASVALEVRVAVTNNTISVPAIGNSTSTDSTITQGKRYVEITNSSPNENVTRYRIEIPYSSDENNQYNLYFLYWNGSKWVKLSDYTGSCVPDNNGSLYVYSTGDTGSSLYAEVNHTSIYGMGASVITGSVATTSTSGGGGGGGAGDPPNQATTYISRTFTRVPTIIEFDSLKVKNIYEMALSTVKDVYSFTITVKDLSEKPYETTEFEGTNYNYYRVTQSNLVEKDIENVIISFRIESQWLINNNLDNESIVLARFIDGQWQELPTYYVEQKTIYNYYTAISPGFSYFVISGKEKDEIETSGISIPIPSTPSGQLPPEQTGQVIEPTLESGQMKEDSREKKYIGETPESPPRFPLDYMNILPILGIFLLVSLVIGIYMKKR